MRVKGIFLAVVLAASSLCVATALAEKRVALVIGNGAYRHTVSLPNPPNDARAIAAALTQLGFETELALDLDGVVMDKTLRQFSRHIKAADVALFYYAGHSLSVAGQNYLVPIDARLEEEADLDFEAIPLGLVLRQLERTQRTNLVFLDACRNNPLARNLVRSMGASRSASVGEGLSRITSGIGTLIAFATQPGNVALDGTGQHSPFTAALKQWIATPGLEVRQVMTRVRQAVIEATDGKQVPWDNSSLTGDFYFSPAKTAAVDDPVSEAGAAAPRSGDAGASSGDAAFELEYWNTIKGSQDPDLYRAYLEEFPDGRFASLARIYEQKHRRLAPAIDSQSVSPTPELPQTEPSSESSPGQTPTPPVVQQDDQEAAPTQQARLTPDSKRETATIENATDSVSELKDYLESNADLLEDSFEEFLSDQRILEDADRFERIISHSVDKKASSDTYEISVYFQYCHRTAGCRRETLEVRAAVQFLDGNLEFLERL